MLGTDAAVDGVVDWKKGVLLGTDEAENNGWEDVVGTDDAGDGVVDWKNGLDVAGDVEWEKGVVGKGVAGDGVVDWKKGVGENAAWLFALESSTWPFGVIFGG